MTFCGFCHSEELEELKMHLVGGLIEQKMLRKFRFLGKFHLVAVDATGTATFDLKHCDQCLTKTLENGSCHLFPLCSGGENCYHHRAVNFPGLRIYRKRPGP